MKLDEKEEGLPHLGHFFASTNKICLLECQIMRHRVTDKSRTCHLANFWLRFIPDKLACWGFAADIRQPIHAETALEAIPWTLLTECWHLLQLKEELQHTEACPQGTPSGGVSTHLY
jgi:hypothetical protein